MNVRTLRYRGAVGPLLFAATAALVGLGGCGSVLLGLVQPPDEIPSELTVVLEDVSTFRDPSPSFQLDPNEPLEPIAGTTGVADVGELAGCWGSSYRFATTIPGRALDVSQALKFDAASGQLERFSYQSLVIVAPVVMVERGAFSLDANGSGTFHVTQVLSTARTGRLTDDTDRFETLPVYEVQLAWDGDELLTNFSEIDTPRTSGGFADRVRLRHQRFDCP